MSVDVLDHADRRRQPRREPGDDGSKSGKATCRGANYNDSRCSVMCRHIGTMNAGPMSPLPAFQVLNSI
jgi:hypothetical protein